MKYMDNIFGGVLRRLQRREADVPRRRDDETPSASGGSFEERIVRPRGEHAALTVSAVYRAVELRAKTMAQMLMQLQKLNAVGGNFVQASYGPHRRLNYLLQVAPNPVMSASSLFEQITIRRLLSGNAFVYVERDQYGDVRFLWLASCGGYDHASGCYSLGYLGESGPVFLSGVDRSDVLHFPNTYRDADGFWGLSTVRYAIDTLSLVKTEGAAALESAAKGGRVKLLVSEERQQGGGTLAYGMLSKGTAKAYAREISEEIYRQDVVSLRGLEKVQQISLSAAEMQMIELLGMGMDDVARFFATPRALLMMDSNSHYTSYKDATQEYYTRTIAPDAREMEDEFNRKLLSEADFGRRRFHLCEQPLMRMDRESQAKVDQLNLQTGAKTVNEIRAQYDMPAVPDGDRVYVSTNLAELGSDKLRSSVDGGSHGSVEEEGGAA